MGRPRQGLRALTLVALGAAGGEVVACAAAVGAAGVEGGLGRSEAGPMATNGQPGQEPTHRRPWAPLEGWPPWAAFAL